MRITRGIRLSLLLVLALALPAAAQGGGGGGGGGGGDGGGGGAVSGYSSTGGNTLLPREAWLASILCPAAGVSLAGLLIWAGFESQRRRLVFVLLLLEDGTAAVPAFDEVLRSAKFNDPDGRQALIRRLHGICVKNRILADYCRIDRVRGYGRTALFLAERQMKLATIDPDSLANAAPDLLKQRVIPGDAALLGVAVELFPRSLAGVSPGIPTLALLNRLCDIPNDYLYLFYAPNPGKRLTPEDGARLHAVLREHAATLEPEPA